MQIFTALFALFLATPATADVVMTLNWPDQARDGDLYVAELIDYDDEVFGQWFIEVTPGDSVEMPTRDAAMFCLFAAQGSRPITALRGIFHDAAIAMVPDRNTGKICVSLFAQKSTAWDLAL